MKHTLAILAALLMLGMGARAGITINREGSSSLATGATNSYALTDLEVGDVVVLTCASNKKGDVVGVTAFPKPGVDGAVGPQTPLTSDIGMGIYPTAWSWSYTVITNGAVNFGISADGGISAITAAYVVRADSGAIELAGSAEWNDADGASNLPSYSLDYTFGSALSDGVLIEVVNGRKDGFFSPATNTVDKVGGANIRVISSFDGVSGSSWSSVYTLSAGVDSHTSSALGMVFAEVTGENRAPTFNSDPVVAPGTSTNATYSSTLVDYATDLDGDPMTFWKTNGPAWLNVALNGALTGTAPGTAGLNSWMIFVADNNGGTNSATLNINVATSEFYEVPLTSTNLYVQGAKFTNIDGNGMNFHRFDFGGSFVNVNAGKAKTTSGVKLSFYTRSDAVKLYFNYMAGDENRNSRFGLYQNGTQVTNLYYSQSITNIVITLTSESSPGELVCHDVVLPNWSNPILSKMELKNGEVLETGNPFPSKKLVVLGNSISHGTGQGASYQTYPYIAADMMDMELFNMAVGGGKIAPEVADLLQHFDPVDAIWVLAGYNDWQGASESIDSITNDYETLLATIRLHQPDAEVFCCTLTYTTATNDLESGVTAVEVRAGVASVVNARIAAGDSKLHLVNGDEYSDATYLNDGVHFSEPGAAMFATNVVAIMDPILNPPKPNVLFIAIDDINPILGSFGNTLIQTPNMDRLAARGMLFKNAHCQWAVCGPSRASLMTGLMPEQTGVMGFIKMRGISANGVRDNSRGVTNIVTIPQYFISHGYETAAVGKINDNRCVGSINPDGTINEDGSTVDDPPSWSYGFINTSGVGSTSAIRTTDGQSVKLAAESVDQPASSFTDGVAATLGLARLNVLAAGNKPFFLGVGFKKPHLPFLAPKSSWDLYAHDDFTPHPFQTAMLNVTPYTFNNITELRTSYYLELDGNGKALPLDAGILPDDQQKTLLHGYYACISHVDEQVGRLLDELDVLGLTSNTIVVLWGDHGFHLGDHNEWGKHTNLEQATRVPFIISAPGYPGGLKTSAPVGLLDIFPTLCELAGLPEPVQPPNSVDPSNRPLAGRSLVPILGNPDARVQTGIMNHYGSGNYGYAYRTERYRYTEWINSSGTVLARELYDYETDPMETVNLAVYPECEALMYQFSVASRSAGEAGGCDRLKASAALPVPANKSLPGLGISGGRIAWPDAAGSTYHLLSKTNLLDSSWSTNQTGLSGSPVVVTQTGRQEFYRVDVAE